MSIQSLNILGKRKVPRYIYHFTDKVNYQRILDSGKLKMGFDEYVGHCVCAVELKNFLRFWGKDKALCDVLQKELLSFITRNTKDFVVLRIPTKSLDKTKLRVRDQISGNVFSSELAEKVDSIISDFYKKYPNLHGLHTPETEKIAKELRKKLNELDLPPDLRAKLDYLMNGLPCDYSRGNRAVEFFYTDSIPVENIEKIGEATFNLPELFSYSAQSLMNYMQKLFTNLFKNAPEAKSVRLKIDTYM